MIVLSPNGSNSYTVPADKNFVIKSGIDATTPITLDDQIVSFFSGAPSPIVVPKNIEIKNNGNDEIILTGYLLE